MIEAMVRYGEYLTKKEELDLESFEDLLKVALIENKTEALDKLVKFFRFTVDFHSTIIYVYDEKGQEYYEVDDSTRLKIFPIAKLSGKIINAVTANHLVIRSNNIEKYRGIIIQRSTIDKIRKELLKKEFKEQRPTSLNNHYKEKFKKMVMEKLKELLANKGINLRSSDVLAMVEKFEIDKDITKIVIIPKTEIKKIDVRKWVIEKLLFRDKPSISQEAHTCPLCGRTHHWNNIKLFFPINIQSEKTLNFLPNLSPEGKQSVCVTCAYNLLRLTDPSTQFIIKSKYHATILAYPHGHTIGGIRFAESALRELMQKSKEGLFALPGVVWHITNRQNVDEIFGEINSSEMWLYLTIKEQKAERVMASYHITDFSKLAHLGKYQPQITQFQRTINEYLNVLPSKNKTQRYKLVLSNMLASMYANFDIQSLNTSFIRHIGKTIIQKAKNPQLYGKYFISSYLFVCGGDSLSKKRSVDVYRGIYSFGVTIGELWRQLAEVDKTHFNSYKAKIMKLDTPNINVLSDTVRYMIQKISEELSDKEAGALFSKHKDFPKIVTDIRARELFVTGAYFGFFSPIKEKEVKKHESNT